MQEPLNKINTNANIKVSKVEQYEFILRQAQTLLDSERDLIANMANIAALLKETFAWLWVGFYRVDNAANQLVLAPFQGPLACTRIDYGKGVCGEAWATGQTQIVADVNAHPNHIACSSLSRSEIVVPVKDNNGQIIAVLDIDSAELNTFDQVDGDYLQMLVSLMRE